MGISGRGACTKQRRGMGMVSHKEGMAPVTGGAGCRKGKGQDLAGKEGRATQWKESQLAALLQPLPAHLLGAPPITN